MRTPLRVKGFEYEAHSGHFHCRNGTKAHGHHYKWREVLQKSVADPCPGFMFSAWQFAPKSSSITIYKCGSFILQALQANIMGISSKHCRTICLSCCELGHANHPGLVMGSRQAAACLPNPQTLQRSPDYAQWNPPSSTRTRSASQAFATKAAASIVQYSIV